MLLLHDVRTRPDGLRGRLGREELEPERQGSGKSRTGIIDRGNKMRIIRLTVIVLALLLAALAITAVSAEEAADLSAQCTFKTDRNAWKYTRLVNGNYEKGYATAKVKVKVE